MIGIELNKDLSTQLYIQLFEQLAHKINSGRKRVMHRKLYIALCEIF